MKIGSLCTGYGGLDLAIEAAFNAETVWTCEIDRFASQIIQQRFDKPNLGDLKTVNWQEVEPIDILTAGYPCQPFSHAGYRKGTEDERHIWPHIKEIIGTLKPRLVILENVRGHLSLGFKDVLKDLAEIGYDARWDIVRASGMKTLKLLDVAVPLSAFGSTVLGVYKILDTENLSGYVFGHAGDGNLHVLIASDSRNEEIWEKTLRAELKIVKLAIDAEGTITGEHGIGASKTHFLRLEHGSAVDLMRAVKNAFDPKGILNSGKVLPPISTQEGVD